MKKAIVFLFVLCLGAVAHAQSAEKRVKVAIPGGKHYLYRLTLTDKKGTPFSVKKPQAFLSQRAIDRRKRQHISVTESDLPVSPKYTIFSYGFRLISSLTTVSPPSPESKTPIARLSAMQSTP